MPIEVVTFISDLNPSNPVGSTDKVQTLDDHARLTKLAILNTFPNITGAVDASHTELSLLAGVTGYTGTGPTIVKAASPTITGATLTGPTLDAPTFTGAVAFPPASIADAALSANVALRNAANVFTADQRIANDNATLNFYNAANSARSGFLQFNTTSVAFGTELANAIDVYTAGGSRLSISAGGNFDFKGGSVTTANLNANEVGYKGRPPTGGLAASYATVATDAGKHITYAGSGGGAHTFTITDAVHPPGTEIVFVNYGSSGAVLIANTGTMYLGGTLATGVRTLGLLGVATALKLHNGIWVISGPGLT